MTAPDKPLPPTPTAYLLLVAALFLAGCIEVQLDLAFDSSGGGSVTTKVLQLPGMPFPLSSADLARDDSIAPLVNTGRITVTDSVENGRQCITLAGRFSNDQELNDLLRPVGRNFTGSFEKNSAGEAVVRLEGVRYDPGMAMKVSVTMPGRILEASAGRFQGNRVDWEPRAGFPQSLMVRSEVSALALDLGPLLGLAVLAAMALGGFLLWRRHTQAAAYAPVYPVSRAAGRGDAPAPAASPPVRFCRRCGAPREPHAAFCSDCGSPFD
jgi:hypothetical protein